MKFNDYLLVEQIKSKEKKHSAPITGLSEKYYNKFWKKLLKRKQIKTNINQKSITKNISEKFVKEK